MREHDFLRSTYIETVVSRGVDCIAGIAKRRAIQQLMTDNSTSCFHNLPIFAITRIAPYSNVTVIIDQCGEECGERNEDIVRLGMKEYRGVSPSLQVPALVPAHAAVGASASASERAYAKNC